MDAGIRHSGKLARRYVASPFVNVSNGQIRYSLSIQSHLPEVVLSLPHGRLRRAIRMITLLRFENEIWWCVRCNPKYLSIRMIQFHLKVDPYDHGHQPYDHEHQPYAEPRYRLEGRAPDTYYIVPAGTNVIFQDEDGNEITRYKLSVA